MPTFTELLPPTKSAPKSGFRWKPSGPGIGLLFIETTRLSACYQIAEFQTPWDGRAFHFTCLGGQTDRESIPEGYDVFLSHSGREFHCGCKGFAYGRGKPCKHIESVRAIFENDWMDLPVDLDADTGRTEIDDQAEQF